MLNELKKMANMVKAKANTILDRTRNEMEELDLAYNQQTEALNEVKTGLTKLVTQKKNLENKRADMSADVARLDRQAQDAVNAGKDDLATRALREKSYLTESIAALNVQIKELKASEIRMKANVTKYEDAISQLGIKKETLRAQLEAATVQADVGNRVAGLSGGVDVNEAVDRLGNKIGKLNARSEAIDDLVQDGSLNVQGTDSLTSQLNDVNRQSTIDSELARLKKNKK